MAFNKFKQNKEEYRQNSNMTERNKCKTIMLNDKEI